MMTSSIKIRKLIKAKGEEVADDAHRQCFSKRDSLHEAQKPVGTWRTPSRRTAGHQVLMQVSSVINQVESAVAAQIAVSGADRRMEAASTVLMSALTPAIREAALTLAEQAAVEVRAQLPDRQVNVVLQEGDPTIQISSGASSGLDPDEELAARITVRLPDSLKGLIEDAAGETGDSVNSWVIRALSSGAKSKSRGKRVTGSIDL